MRKLWFLPLLLLCVFAYAQAPLANFTVSQTSGCVPVIITFKDQSTGSPTSWKWDFGNGVTSTSQNPSTTYFSAGTYTITLTATNANGSNTITRQGLITIYEKPTVNFTVDRQSGCSPVDLTFADSSVASTGTRNVAWQWDFGNGTQSTEQSPVARYTQSGSYTVALRVTSDKGCFATAVKSSYINISKGVTAAFTNNAVERCTAPFPVQFTNSSTGPGTLSYSWNFGDANVSDQKDPAHAYNAPGTYSVSLAVSSSDGCSDTIRKNNLISIPLVTTSFTAPDTACVQTSVSFINTSSPAAQSTVWRFGDGTQATTVNSTKTYTAPGVYPVQLISRYNHCRDTLTKMLTVLGRPRALFKNTIERTSCRAPFNVNFEDSSENATSWLWNFGDGQTSTERNPSHTYNNLGSYRVTLTVKNGDGCTSTYIQDNFVQIREPEINFVNLPQAGCIPYTASFSANVNTAGQVVKYNWDLGNGVTSEERTPQNIYQNQGNYNVSLTITTSQGCTKTASVSNAVVVGERPVIDFSADPNPVCAYKKVQFTGTASVATEWAWNFGRAGTSTQQNPEVVFTAAGTYSVTLVVTNNGCRETLTKKDYITVMPPVAAFSLQKDCENPSRFTYTDRSLGATAVRWDFGDNSAPSTEANPTHTFANLGNYTVSLTATNGACSHTIQQVVRAFTSSLSFTADKVVACKTATIQFISKAEHATNVAAYQWDFGNNTSATTAHPTANYTTAGDYNVQVTATDIYGCKIAARQDNYIRINGPIARFTAFNNIGCAGLTAGFKDNSTTDGTNAITTWQWTYGDGSVESVNSSADQSHLYKNPGIYSVRLTVTDAAGCKDSIRIDSLVRTSSPKAAFAVSDTVSCLGSTLRFTNQSMAQSYSSQWNFGNGAVSSDTNSTNLYTDTGFYSVKLKITDNYGCSDSLTKTNYVRIVKTVAQFTASDTVGTCTPYEVRFTNRSQFFASSRWNFTTGSSTATNPSHTFMEARTYPVTLYVTGRGGCVDSTQKTIVIFPDTATKITYSPIEGCKPLQLKAVVKSPAKKTFTWDFGDGELVRTLDAETVHLYKTVGNFLPRLILADSGNCLVPVNGIDTVRVKGAVAHFGVNKQLFCDSAAVFFTDSTKLNDNSISRVWDFGDGASSTLQNPVHRYSKPGHYTVSLAVVTSSQCRDTVVHKQLIKVVQSPSIDINGPAEVCKDESSGFNGIYLRQDTSVVRWYWQLPGTQFTGGLQSPVKQYSTPGDFTITAVATNNSGCADTAVKSFKVHPLPSISIPSHFTALVGIPVPLQPANYSPNVVSYQWQPAAGLSCTDCPQPIAKPRFNTNYQVLVTDENGCRNTAEVRVVVVCQNLNVFVPNTFSPNGDGSNDVFYVRGSGLARVKSLRIFNRLGEVIFERQNFPADDATQGWDGTFKGSQLAPDTYIYQLDVFCDNSESVRFDGSITLIR